MGEWGSPCDLQDARTCAFSVILSWLEIQACVTEHMHGEIGRAHV